MTRKLISTHIARAYFTAMPLYFEIEWDPYPKRLTDGEMAIYRQWRDDDVTPAIEAVIGGRMLLVDG